MADGDAGHMLDGDRLGVVAEQIRWGTTDAPQRLIQAGDQRAQRLVPGGDHHAVAAPGQPRAKQARAPPGPSANANASASGADPDLGALAPVELQPHARLGDPGPIAAALPRPPRLLELGDGAAGGALQDRKSTRL